MLTEVWRVTGPGSLRRRRRRALPSWGRFPSSGRLTGGSAAMQSPANGCAPGDHPSLWGEALSPLAQEQVSQTGERNALRSCSSGSNSRP